MNLKCQCEILNSIFVLFLYLSLFQYTDKISSLLIFTYSNIEHFLFAKHQTIMSDNFQEMGWQPVEPEDIQNHQTLLMARFLSDHGFFSESTDSGNLPPPASKAVVSGLPEKKCTTEDEKCAICLKPNTPDTADEVFKVLPCKHAFHRACIMPWLEKVTCIH